MEGELEVGVRTVGGVAVVVVDGEVDLVSSGGFGAALTRARGLGAPVVVDLTACTFLDTSGIAQLVGLARALRPAGRRPTLVAAPGTIVARVLGFVDVAGWADVHPRLDAALAAHDRAKRRPVTTENPP